MNLLNYIDRYILAAVLGPVETDFGIKDTLGGILMAAFVVSYSVFSPLVGWLGDRVTRKYLLAIGVGVWSIATFASGLAGRFGFPAMRMPFYGEAPGPFWEMLLARSIMGVGEATYAVLAPSLIADLFPKSKRNSAIALFYIAIPVGAAMGYGLGGLIHEFYGWRMAFFVVGLPGLAVALAALALREPPRGAAEADLSGEAAEQQALPLFRAYARLARTRSYVLNVLGLAAFTFSLGGLQAFAPKFFNEVRDMSLKTANLGLSAAVCVSGIVGTALGGWLGDRAGPWLGRVLPPWRGGGYFWLSGLTMFAAVPFIAGAIVLTQPALIFLCMMIGLTFAFINQGPANTILINVTGPHLRATAVAVSIFFLHFLGDILSPPLIGWVSEDTGSLLRALMITVPCMALSGLFFCLGAPFLRADEQAANVPSPEPPA
jgi:MFS family permease